MATSTKPRTIYFVWHYTNWGGAQIFLLAIMKIARPQWNLHVILPRVSSPEFLRFMEQLGVPYEFLESSLDNGPAPTLRRKIERQWRRIRTEAESFRRLLRYDLRENILHIESAPWQSWMLFTALALRRGNVFVTLHNFLPSAPKWREVLWRVRMQFVSRLPGVHFIASNVDTKERMRGWVSNRFWNNVTVAHTCVDPPQILAAAVGTAEVIELKRKHSITSDKTVVLAVGQFVDRKGRWIFLEAASSIVHERDDICFVWLTPSLPDADEADRIADYALGDNFKLILSETVGTDRVDVLRFFNIADIFALPSYVEGLPIALLEAMALGIPSISTNVYAIPEAVKDGDTGILIEPGDAKGLAAGIMRLLEDRALYTRLAKKGSDFVLKNFDERDAARKCLAAYTECFSDAR